VVGSSWAVAKVRVKRRNFMGFSGDVLESLGAVSVAVEGLEARGLRHG
jgi:hypothetical protein